ncbi:MAG: hypothetical protein J6J36_08905 [Clostridia bacterium]|nr:hypothetical protein [Clostridia bacterium]
MDKYSNKAIIGNKNIVASFNENGWLTRFCYPYVDGRQFVDYFNVGIKINDSNIIYIHDDINNSYNQRYIENTNILLTEIKNAYFNIAIEQTDYVLIEKNILVRKYVFENKNSIDLDTKFIVNSKILSNSLENYGSKIIENGIIQYNHNYALSIFSKEHLIGYKLNDVASQIQGAVLKDKDYIGMSNEAAISYNIGKIEPGEKQTFFLYVYIDENSCGIEDKILSYLRLDDEIELEGVKKYWRAYLNNHVSIKLPNDANEYNKKIMEIYNRTILLYPLLINYDYGGIAAALEVDDERNRSGGYRYCWTRDAIFITKAFDLLKMEKDSELFYNKFCKSTQSKNGMWEQRFYSDGRLAPCWGYQVDETSSVIYGIYNHYKHTKDKEFLEKNLKMCENATKFLLEYVQNILELDESDLVKKELQEKYKKVFNPAKHESYDLWEMNEGVHLYSLSSIIAAFRSMISIYKLLDDENEKNARLKREKRNKLAQKLNKYNLMLEGFIRSNFIDEKTKILKRNLKDEQMDISVIGSVYPFEIFDINEETIKNTVEKINMTLKTYKDGYLRFEGDSYMNGDKPWTITTLWMALYYLKNNDKSQAEKCFKYVVNTASKHGFLSEQVSNDDPNFQWVIGLGWAHAMFIIVLDELLKQNKE